MKVAIFYDWLNQWGGAEKVLLSLIKLYPQAPVYTLVYDHSKTPWLPPKTTVITSFINRLPFAANNPIFYTPFYDLALEQFDFSQFDIVISTTSTVGHCLLTNPRTLLVCYFHNINRYLYQTPRKFRLLSPLLNLYKKIDFIYSRRPNISLCNSKTVSHRISSHYHLTPQIIHPGIDTDFFVPKGDKKQYFLIVSRLVPHKNIDVVIKAFKKVHHQLIIVGTGRQEQSLKNLSGDSTNIKFVGSVSNSELLNYYQNCLALICPQLEDFGLSAIEAQACGRPVIAYGRGGNTETIINGQTGIFFEYPTVNSIIKAINNFQKKQFSSSVCQNNAAKFSEKSFMLNFKQSLSLLWKKHQTTTF